MAVLTATGLPNTTRVTEERELVELYHRALTVMAERTAAAASELDGFSLLD